MKCIKIDYVPKCDCPPEVSLRLALLTHTWQYTTTLQERNVKLIVSSSNPSQQDKVYKNIIVILTGLLPQSKCFADIQITILLTDHKKVLPVHGVLDRDNVNTGYSRECFEIVVYREEEWRKVFIHECFHFLGFDNGLDGQNVTDIFPFPKVDLRETFCEVWARLINCAIEENIANCIERERHWACYQMVKVLDYNGLTYANLLEKQHLNLYKENTNVFAYIILSAILLQDATQFLEWSKTFNAPNGLPNLIRKLFKTPTFLANVAEAEIEFRNKHDNTMRMSCV